MGKVYAYLSSRKKKYLVILTKRERSYTNVCALHDTYYLFNSTTSDPGTAVSHSCIPQSYSLLMRPSFWFTPLILYIYTNIRITAASSIIQPCQGMEVSILCPVFYLCRLKNGFPRLSVYIKSSVFLSSPNGDAMFAKSLVFLFLFSNIIPIPGIPKFIQHLLVLGILWLFLLYFR